MPNERQYFTVSPRLCQTKIKLIFALNILCFRVCLNFSLFVPFFWRFFTFFVSFFFFEVCVSLCNTLYTQRNFLCHTFMCVSFQVLYAKSTKKQQQQRNNTSNHIHPWWKTDEREKIALRRGGHREIGNENV